jgi:hypothetical protein
MIPSMLLMFVELMKTRLHLLSSVFMVPVLMCLFSSLLIGIHVFLNTHVEGVLMRDGVEVLISPFLMFTYGRYPDSPIPGWTTLYANF